LRNATALERLNPHAVTLRRMEQTANENNRQKRELAIKAKRGFSKGKSADEKKAYKTNKKASRAFITGVQKNLTDAYEK